VDDSGANTLEVNGDVVVGENLQWSLAVASSGFDLPQLSEYAEGRLQGSLHIAGRVAAAGWQLALADVNLHGEVNGLPASVAGYAGMGGDLLFARSDLHAQINGAQLMLRVPGAPQQPGQLRLTVDDLGRWQPGSRGSLHLAAHGIGAGHEIRMDGQLRELRWQGLEIDSGTIRGSYRPEAAGVFAFETIFSDVNVGGLSLSLLQLEASGSEVSQSLTLLSRGDVEGALALSGAPQQGENWAGRLAPATLRTPQGTWRLDQAVAMQWSGADARLAVAGHCWRQPQVRICPGDLLLGEAGSGSLEVAGGMAFLADFFPGELDISGDLQMQFEAAWSPATALALNGTARTHSVLVTRHFGVGESVSVAWDKADAVLRRGDKGLQLAAQIHRRGKQVVSLDLDLPEARQGPLAGEVTFGGLQLETLAPWTPSLSRLEGELTGQLQLAGTVDQPLARGVVNLAGGNLAMIGNPTEVEGLELTLDLQGDSAQLRGRGLLGAGELQLQGSLLTDPELRLDIAVTGARHQILIPPSTELLVSESLQLSATAALVAVTGDITVHEGELRHEELPQGSVALSADVVEVDFAGNVLREQRPFDTRMDIRVQLRDRFKVVGSTLRATLGGDLQLTQIPGQPMQLFGSLNVVGGELRAFKQALQIQRGTIAFSGPSDKPEFNIRAEREIRGDNVTVGAQLLGTLEEPVLEVYSDPVMSQGETMSYLVRDRGLDSGSGADGTALALAIGADFVNESGIVSELNRMPGISNIAFGTSGSEDDTAATVSGYVGDRLYLSYGLGLYEPINVLTARLYFNTRLWLEVVSQLENSVDLYYSFDIN
jgi:autotransporter translocation and assembly factor TamB